MLCFYHPWSSVTRRTNTEDTRRTENSQIKENTMFHRGSSYRSVLNTVKVLLNMEVPVCLHAFVASRQHTDRLCAQIIISLFICSGSPVSLFRKDLFHMFLRDFMCSFRVVSDTFKILLFNVFINCDIKTTYVCFLIFKLQHNSVEIY